MCEQNLLTYNQPQINNAVYMQIFVEMSIIFNFGNNNTYLRIERLVSVVDLDDPLTRIGISTRMAQDISQELHPLVY